MRLAKHSLPGCGRGQARKQYITCSAPYVTARLHSGAAGTYLWVSNPNFTPSDVTLTFSSAWGPFSSAEAMWGEE